MVQKTADIFCTFATEFTQTTPFSIFRMKNKLFFLPLLLIALASMLQACSDDETYADKRKREDKQIKAFLTTGVGVKDEDSGEYLLYAPGNIKVISESEFYANDSTTDVSKNEYVYFDNTGVYMQIIEKGTGSKLADGETARIITRYTEYDIATDSILTTNRLSSYEMTPDIMICSNSSGSFTGTFTQGAMLQCYSSAAVPAGWLIPLTYINLSRLDSPDARLAEVRLIVPGAQGQVSASSTVYPCFYDIIYQRGR